MVTPDEADVSPEDLSTAMSTAVASTVSSEVTSEQQSTYRESIESTLTTSEVAGGLTLSSPVTLWNSKWISYDNFYRPVFTNPYSTPLQVLYEYDGQTRVVTLPPRQRAVLDVPNAGVYNFTALTQPAAGPVTNLSVGSFSGGGYQPAPGQARPAQPPKLNVIKNALVQVKFTKGESQPFRVRSLVDLGSDPAVNGATKVLLDDEVPAWGQWSKDPKGTALFVITTTQLLPGINRPGQYPLPGYQVKLTASNHDASWVETNKTILIGIAVGAGVLALVGVGLVAIRRRRATD